jgi:putative FmdB family regulatory protein
MPIYEYHCLSCRNEFETLVRSSGPAPACPQCLGTDLEKKLSTFAERTASAASVANVATSPCGTCGAPGGPGSCRLDA